jgi:hypothetical protein
VKAEGYSIAEQAHILVGGDLLGAIVAELGAECFTEFRANIQRPEFARVRAAEDAAQRMRAVDDIVAAIRMKAAAHLGGVEHGKG